MPRVALNLAIDARENGLPLLNEYIETKNMTVPNEILRRALTLKPDQKAELVDKLLSSLDEPDSEIDELWAREVESRIDAYEQGKIKAVSFWRVLEKYK